MEIKKISDYLSYPHLLTPHQFLVVYIFSAFPHHRAITIEEMVEVMRRDRLVVSPEVLEEAIDYFIEKGCLVGNPDTGKYFTLE